MNGDDDLRWLQTTANELNNLLQVISESSRALKCLFTDAPEAMRYYSFMANGLERARNVTAEIADRAGGLSVQTAPAPLKSVPKVENPQNDNPGCILNPNGHRELIMLIDDEDIVVDLATAVLTSEGYRVIAATDVFKALSIYKDLRDKISLVMLDYTMPIMDGSEVFEELKAINPNAPIMLSSGFAEQQKVRAMLVRGLRGFLPKPYTKQKLLAQVRSTLDAISTERTGIRRVL